MLPFQGAFVTVRIPFPKALPLGYRMLGLRPVGLRLPLVS